MSASSMPAVVCLVNGTGINGVFAAVALQRLQLQMVVVTADGSGHTFGLCKLPVAASFLGNKEQRLLAVPPLTMWALKCRL